MIQKTCQLVFSITMCSAMFVGRADAQVTAKTVQRSIDRGVTFLKKTQSQDSGGWPEYQSHSCGLTALCTLALMNCGLEHNDPNVSRALKYLREIEPQKTYSIALQTMVFCKAKQARDLEDIRRNVRKLEDLLIRPSNRNANRLLRVGSWPYQKNQGNGDPSNSQFALLALSAAEERGVPVDPEVFKLAEDYWIGLQLPSGGWSYSKSNPSESGSMTCAGIASLVITRGRSGAGQARIENGKLRCCGGDLDERDPVTSGLEWLGRNFLVSANPRVRVHGLYYLYALERVGRLTGNRLIGGHDWYREGAEFLLSQQDDFDGSWRGIGSDDKIPTVGTSFALLFLGKGKRQVVISRLQHGMAEDWNWHPDSLRQLTRHVEKQWNQELTWQTVRFGGATVEDLMQTPVLFISGSSAFVATPREKEVLKSYIEQGGFIFAQATAGAGCQSGREFEDSLRALAEELFDAPLDKLPPSHPVWIAEHRIDPSKMPRNFWLYGVQACCRTSIVYSQVSLACLWELSDPTGRERLPEKLKGPIDTGVKIGQNVIAYATGRQLKDKLEQRQVIDVDKATDEIPRNTLVIPRLALGAGGAEASRALPNLLEWMRRHIDARIASRTKEIGFNEEALQEHSVIFMHGRYSFSFSDEQRRLLRNHLESGGSIIAGAVCGSEEFAAAFRREVQLVLPKASMAPMPSGHEALTSRFRGYDLSSVTLRKPSEGGSGIVVKQQVGSPLIEFMRHEERDCVFFSPYDLSCALENQAGIQCAGYDTEDAAKIGINLILYAMLQ